MDDIPMKQEVSPSVDPDSKTADSTGCYSPLNLKLSPSQGYLSDDLKVTPSYGTEESIRTQLQDIFVTPEANLIALEEKARSLRQLYGTLTISEKATFFRTLSSCFGVDHQMVERLSAQLASAAVAQNHQSSLRLSRIEDRLRSALVPRYQQLFTLFSRIENGIRFLLQLRSDVITILGSPGVDQDSHLLQTMNSILHNLLSIWMSVGSLHLEKVTWESPCDLLQKICAYEAVQSIRNWSDLKRRVGPYRRCLAFTHVTLPREPVVVIHAAITSQISGNMQSILENIQATPGDREHEIEAPVEVLPRENAVAMTTAVFYSIASTQKGLQGIEFGNHLIKRVIAELQAEFPRMHQFASLSPIPGFRDWLVDELNLHIHLRDIGEDPDQSLLSSQEIVDLSDVLGSSESAIFTVLRDVLQSSTWVERPRWFTSLKGLLLRQCARYLYVAKKRGYVLNPVANFHLRNGAVLWRLNWMADMSSRGVSASFGIMANYRYYPEQIEINSKNYIERRTILISDQVTELVRQLPEMSTDECR